MSNFKDANDKEVYGSEKLGFSVTIYLFIMNVVDPTEVHNEIKQKEQAMKELKETQCQS